MGGKTTNMLMMNAGKEITLSQALFVALSQGSGGGATNGFRYRIANLELWPPPARSMMGNLFVAERKHSFICVSSICRTPTAVRKKQSWRRMGERPETESQIKSASL